MRKKTLIILVLLIVLVSILGVSYASWLFTGRQKDFNTLGSKCFELTMMNESEGITLDKTYPISDEEGLSTTGYTFTIKNTCNTYATYEVNLEDMLVEEKRLSGEYIKVSINDGSPINLKELEEKEPTIEESDKAYELTSGPWFCRENDLAHGKGSGIFAFNATYGNASENGAFRIVLSPI